MTTHKLNLVGGGVLRTRSTFRYIVVGGHGGTPFVEYRTDDLARARKRAAKRGTTILDPIEADAMDVAATLFRAALADYMAAMKRADAHTVPAGRVYDTVSGELA